MMRSDTLKFKCELRCVFSSQMRWMTETIVYISREIVVFSIYGLVDSRKDVGEFRFDH